MAFVATLLATLQLSLTAPAGHAPKIGVHWPYTLRATVAGKLVPGRLTAQIVDPIGGLHVVEFGTSTKQIRNVPFKGVFRDFIVWPPESRGVPLKLRLTVVAAGMRKVVQYAVVPHA